MKDLIAKLIEGNSLDQEEAVGAMNTIMSGDATPAQVAGFLKNELPDLCHYVRELDTIYLRLQAEKQKRESKAKKK